MVHEKLYMDVKDGLRLNIVANNMGLVRELEGIPLPENFSQIYGTIIANGNRYKVIVENPTLEVHVISSSDDNTRVRVRGDLTVSNGSDNPIVYAQEILLGDSNNIASANKEPRETALKLGSLLEDKNLPDEVLEEIFSVALGYCFDTREYIDTLKQHLYPN
jgi:hypothetical protein